MTKILCIGALAMASIYYAQIYPVSTIPENLKKNANAVIRKDITNIDIRLSLKTKKATRSHIIY